MFMIQSDFFSNRFKQVQFEIAATADPGVFGVSATFMGVDVDKVELIFQVSLLKLKNTYHCQDDEMFCLSDLHNLTLSMCCATD